MSEQRLGVAVLVTLLFTACGADWRRQVAGTYTGTLTSKGVAIPAVTTFRFQNDQVLGEYVMNESGAVNIGQLSTPELKQEHTVQFAWTDKYGTGWAVFTFSADFSSFDGFWGLAQDLKSFPWNGAR